MPSTSFLIKVGARSSKLSQAQAEEVLQELSQHHAVQFEPVWIDTTGDKDKKTSLRHLEKTDFFTREIDEQQLRGDFRIAIHSAKDLPDPIPAGLKMVALTKGVDPSDVLVHNHELQQGAKIGTSSTRREAMLRQWRPDFQCVDIRGTIQERLALLDTGQVDGVVMAKAALIRLRLIDRQWIQLDGDTAPLQGQLAVIAREEDTEMANIFKSIDTRSQK